MATEKMVLITGASRGIGRAIALKLAKKYRLILHASVESSLVSLKTELDGNHEILYADFTDVAATKNFCTELKKIAGKSLYAVVNNAGIAIDKPLMYQSMRDIDAMLSVNMKAPLLISKVALKIFIANNKGVLVNISSCVGQTGNAFQVVYSMTKAAMTVMSKAIAKEVAALNKEHQIRSVSIAPGFIETDMTKELTDSVREAYIKMIPTSHFGHPSDVADAVDFVLSKQASYINGTEIAVNGGII